MLANYIKIAWRNLLKNKAFSLINIFGLAIGMAAFILIIQYTTFELNFDKFHKNYDNIYLLRNDLYNGKTLEIRTAMCPPALGPALKENYSEVDEFSRLLRCIRTVITNEENDKHFRSDDIYFTDASFLNIFSFPLENNVNSLDFSKPNTAIITKEYAEKFFSNENPIGKILKFKSKYFDYSCEIIDVCKDFSHQSHFNFNILVSMPTYKSQRKTYGELTSWNIRSYFTYLLLSPNSDCKKLESQLPEFVLNYRENPEEGQHSKFVFQHLKNIHLCDFLIKGYVGNINKKIIYALIAIALIIILIAWINFINLSTAKALDRAKEVGIRKVSGAFKRNLIYQFLSESFLVNLVSFILAITIIQLTQVQFSQIVDKPINSIMFENKFIWLGFIGLFMAGTILSGIYPALLLSSFKPALILKGNFKNQSKGINMRKGLVIFQFMASVILIFSATIIYKQIIYMQNKDLGMDTEQLLVVRTPIFTSYSSFDSETKKLKNKLKQYPEIIYVANSYYIPGKELRWREYLSANIDNIEPKIFGVYNCDYDFIPAYKFKILYGRAFSEKIETDKDGIILNETGARLLGYDEPKDLLNKQIYASGNSKTVIGIMKDYHHISVKNNIEPTALILSNDIMNYTSIKIESSNISKTLKIIEKNWKELFPNDPFDYYFIDEFINRQYKTDIRFSKVFVWFTALAIFIACLGLFGLSLLNIVQRTKEIGIRKVIGSSIFNILYVLSKDTLILIFLSTMIALPIAYLVMKNWLNSYAFHIEIIFWNFLIPVLVILIVAIITISFQVIKTAKQNPVEALRYE